MTADPARAASSWTKAKAHRAEALAQDPESSPMSVIHASYYAMFHAARAVLFQQTGSAPKTHDRTIQQFGLLVRDFDDALRVSAKAFNAIKDQRTAADYNEAVSPGPEEAREALQAAVTFLAVCGSRYGFPDLP
jgi:uncharacterized protein (UPF0332 family)